MPSVASTGTPRRRGVGAAAEAGTLGAGPVTGCRRLVVPAGPAPEWPCGSDIGGAETGAGPDRGGGLAGADTLGALPAADACPNGPDLGGAVPTGPDERGMCGNGRDDGGDSGAAADPSSAARQSSIFCGLDCGQTERPQSTAWRNVGR
jgi:hypothetical protein